MGNYHAGFGREGACFLPDLLGVAAHSYLRVRKGGEPAKGAGVPGELLSREDEDVIESRLKALGYD